MLSDPGGAAHGLTHLPWSDVAFHYSDSVGHTRWLVVEAQSLQPFGLRPALLTVYAYLISLPP